MLTSYKSVLSNLAYHLYDLLLLKVLKVEKDPRSSNPVSPHLKPFNLNQPSKFTSDTILPSKLQRILVTTMMTSPLTPHSIQKDILIDLYRAGTPNPLYLTTLLFYKKLFLTTDYVLRSQLGLQLNELTKNSNISSKVHHLLLTNEYSTYSPLLLNYVNRKMTDANLTPSYTQGLGYCDVDT
jgi:hypothetical protein